MIGVKTAVLNGFRTTSSCSIISSRHKPCYDIRMTYHSRCLSRGNLLFSRISSDSNDRDVFRNRSIKLKLSNRLDAIETIHNGHLKITQNDVEFQSIGRFAACRELSLFDIFQCLFPMICDCDIVAQSLELSSKNFLIRDIVLF